MQTFIKTKQETRQNLLSIKNLSSAPVVGVHSGIKVPSPASITDPKSKVPGVTRFPGTLGNDVLPESSSSSAAAACASSPGTVDSKAGDAPPTATAAPPTDSAALDDDDAVDEGQGQMEDEDEDDVDAVPVFSCSAAGKALPS